MTTIYYLEYVRDDGVTFYIQEKEGNVMFNEIWPLISVVLVLLLY